jgi:ATP-dependent helicase HrpA
MASDGKFVKQRPDKFRDYAERDARHTAGLKEWQLKFEERLEKQRKSGSVGPKLMDFRWMLEEMRVSLFAQGLRTPYPISWKRLDKVWSELAG